MSAFCKGCVMRNEIPVHKSTITGAHLCRECRDLLDPELERRLDGVTGERRRPGPAWTERYLSAWREVKHQLKEAR